jgi:hypothetical protein
MYRISLGRHGTSALIAGGVLLALSFAPIVRAAEPAATGDSERVAKLLVETRDTAVQLKINAVTMESFRRMNLDSTSHALAINEIKSEVNELGRQFARLKALEAEASPWQSVAINRIEPYLGELGGYTAAVIERLNGDRTHTFADYDDYLVANADYATDLVTMLTDFVDYGNSRGRVERLGGKLEVPAR